MPSFVARRGVVLQLETVKIRAFLLKIDLAITLLSGATGPAFYEDIQILTTLKFICVRRDIPLASV